MISEYKIRDANIGDIDFLIRATIEADKVNRNISQYSKVFNISEEDMKQVHEIEGNTRLFQGHL